MDEQVKQVVRAAIIKILNETASDANLLKAFKVHADKLHFVPVQYRVLGSSLQSLNIKFGNFIEKLVALVIDKDKKVVGLPISGKKVSLAMTSRTDTLIDQYITQRQLPDSPDECDEVFHKLLSQIFEIERTSSEHKQRIIKDVDALFQASDGRIIYLEIKYNDDHDTGKFVDINRKFLKTYAGLLNYLEISEPDKFLPIIYYFNPRKRWGPIYIPSSHIYRGSQLFDQFFEIEFSQVDSYLYSLGTDEEIIAIFDTLYERIRHLDRMYQSNNTYSSLLKFSTGSIWKYLYCGFYASPMTHYPSPSSLPFFPHLVHSARSINPIPDEGNYTPMRIIRSQSRLTFRTRRRRPGCLSFVMLLGVMLGVGALSSATLNGWINAPRDPAAPDAQSADRRRAAANAFAAGDLDAAVDAARAALALNPVDAAAAALAARALIYRSYADYDRARDRDAAVQLTGDALRRAPDSLDLQAVYAFALAANDQPAEAAQIADRVLERQPMHALARTAQSLAYGSAGGFEIARRESERAVMDSVTFASGAFALDAQRALAIAYGDLGDYARALTSVAEAIALNDQIVLLYFERALYALQIGDTDAATVAYFQVLAIDPENVKARLRLCEVSSLLREHEQAIRYCTDVTERAPAWSEGWYRLGREFFLVGDFSAAQSRLNRCSSLQTMQNIPVEERRFECWYLQGQAAEIRGDCPALIATYNEYREMSAAAQVDGAWTYPPEGPSGC